MLNAPPQSNVEVIRGAKGREKILRILNLKAEKQEKDERETLQAVRRKLEESCLKK